jgi:hypothetical protein
MIPFAKPVLTEDLCIVKKEKSFNTHAIRAIRTLDKRPSILIRDKPHFTSERMLHKDYYRKGSVEKSSGRGSQGAYRQDEFTGGK